MSKEDALRMLNDDYFSFTHRDLDVNDLIYSMGRMAPDKPYTAVLLLAIAAYSTRLNWFDGFYRVDEIMQSEEDTLRKFYSNVYTEYEDILNSDETDGRIFRDTNYNYKELIEIFRTQLSFDGDLSERERSILMNFFTYRNIRILVEASLEN